MIKRITFLMICFTVNIYSYAQQYFTKNGFISFFSKAPLENIKAENNQVISVINFTTGIMQFSLLNNAFHFPKAKMEEHFNEDYIESVKYPRSTFKGIISDVIKINTNTNGTYNIMVKGELTIHGQTKQISIPGTMSVKDGSIRSNAKFVIRLSDYNISIPSIVKNNISDSIEITVSCNYSKK